MLANRFAALKGNTWEMFESPPRKKDIFLLLNITILVQNWATG